MNMQPIELDEKTLSSVLQFFNKGLDSEGYIINQEGKRICCKYSKKQIHKSNFSILPGSYEFINNEAYCFAAHIAKHKLY